LLALRSSQQSSEQLIEVFRGLIAAHKLEIALDVPRKFDGPWALDVEHDESGTFVGVGLYNGCGTVYYYSNHVSFNSCDFSTVSLICHNGRSDFDCLRSWGINLADTQLFWDTELYAHILDSSRRGYGLKTLAKADLAIEYPSYEDIVGKHKTKCLEDDSCNCVRVTLDKQPLELVSAYNAMDVFVAWELYEKQSIIKPSDPGGICNYFEDIERPISFILGAMEARGICVDLKYLAGLKDNLESQKLPIEAEIHNQLGSINLNSPKQLLEALNAKEIYPQFKGKASTDKRALSLLSDKNAVVSNLLRYSELDALLSSFVTPYLERNQAIVHPWFNQCGTRTGRLSCSNPNLLQIPKRTENGRIVRNMFIPRKGMVLGEADYAAIEPRILAHLSGDANLCAVFNQGLDFHAWTAERLNITRDKAKVLNLSVGYRASKYSVQRQLGGTHDEAQAEIDKWWNLFPVLRRWQESTLFDSKRSGFCTTLLGRRIRVENLSEGNSWKREAAERQLINNIAQGSAAEVIKLAMIKLNKQWPNLGLLIQIYDSLVFESTEMALDSKRVADAMESAIELKIPLVVDLKIGPRWGELV